LPVLEPHEPAEKRAADDPTAATFAQPGVPLAPGVPRSPEVKSVKSVVLIDLAIAE
jgi:hypothetical protein